MIAVKYTVECLQLMREFDIERSQVEATLNQPHQYVLTEGLSRILALHWFREDYGVFVDGSVTQKGDGRILEVKVSLAIVVRLDLPGGRLQPSGSEPHWWMKTIARSFGCPIGSKPGAEPCFVYSGPRDQCAFTLPRRGTGLLQLATFIPAEARYDTFWVFDLGRYREWYGASVGAGRPPAASDDPFLEHLKHYVREIPKSQAALCARPGGFRWAVANKIIMMALGREWWDQNCLDPSGSLAQVENLRANLRAIALGEALFNLRGLPGIGSRVSQMRNRDLDSCLRELDTAQLVVRSGLAFRFRETTGTRGEDFEAWLTLPDGREAACEVKGKIGRTDLSEHTILRSLKRAAGQVPKNHPAVLFVWLPEEWISKPGLQELLAKVTRRFFKDYKRVITVEYIWESWVTSESAAIKLGRMTKVREYVNRESRYFDERNVGLINSAPVLDPRGPWTTLDSFIAQYRDRAATAIASVEVDQKKIGDRFQRLRSR